MIIDLVCGDIFHTHCKHIAFAVNAEGYNDTGFAGTVSSRYWPELASTGGNALGDVLRLQRHKTFHALVCHELDKEGWSRASGLVEQCLNSLDVPETEPIAIVLIGSGLVGQFRGADVHGILGGMARSNKRVIVYTRE